MRKTLNGLKHIFPAIKRMNMCHVEYDLVLSYRDDGEYIKPVLNMIGNQIDKLDQAGMLDASGGIHLVNISGDDSVVHLLRAAACHIAPRSMVRINKPIVLYTYQTELCFTFWNRTARYKISGGIRCFYGGSVCC